MSAKRPNRIRTADDAAMWRDVIGEHRCIIVGIRLREGSPVWVFTSDEEIDADPELEEAVKALVKQRLKAEALGFTVWWYLNDHQPATGFTGLVRDGKDGKWTH